MSDRSPMERVGQSRRGYAVLLAAIVASFVVATAGAAAATDDPGAAEPTLLVQLDASGDATVTMVAVYDLDDADEREAFESLVEDDAAREELRDRFVDRMGSVADDAGREAGREMAVTDGSADVRTTGDAGIVAVSAKWTGLAAVDGDRLVVTEPFASGFEPDRPLSIVGPDGYETVTTTPEPDDAEGNAVRYAAGTDLTGFEVALEPVGADGDASGGGTATVDAQPGFEVAIALAALLAVAIAAPVAAVRRR